MGKDSDCLGCGQKFKQKDACVQCSICGLWSHRTCSGLTIEFFNCMVEQQKVTGQTHWACRACSTYAAGMNHRLREIHEKATEAVSIAKETAKETSKLKEQVEKNMEVSSKKVEQSEMSIYEEMNLREEKRKNVVIHGLEEPEGADGRSRMEADKKKLNHIFTVLEANLAVENDVEFCRRIGEKAERARPLIVGFYTEWAKSELLKISKYLADTALGHISIAPDLTEKQRKAEKDMISEAERRNKEELTEEDHSKNWVWKVVGKKGQKRLVKGFDNQRREWNRGGARAVRGTASVETRGGGTLLPPTQRTERWEPRGGEVAEGRKRRLSGGEERTSKRGTGRGRPPLRGRVPRTANSSQQPSQTSSQASQQPSQARQRVSRGMSSEEEEEHQEVSIMEQSGGGGVEAEETAVAVAGNGGVPVVPQPTGIRTGEN
jgi:hypothetical protein